MKLYKAVLCAIGILLVSEVIVEIFSGITSARPNVILNEIEAGFMAVTMAILWRCK